MARLIALLQFLVVCLFLFSGPLVAADIPGPASSDSDSVPLPANSKPAVTPSSSSGLPAILEAIKSDLDPNHHYFKIFRDGKIDHFGHPNDKIAWFNALNKIISTSLSPHFTILYSDAIATTGVFIVRADVSQQSVAAALGLADPNLSTHHTLLFELHENPSFPPHHSHIRPIRTEGTKQILPKLKTARTFEKNPTFRHLLNESELMTNTSPLVSAMVNQVSLARVTKNVKELSNKFFTRHAFSNDAVLASQYLQKYFTDTFTHGKVPVIIRADTFDAADGISPSIVAIIEGEIQDKIVIVAGHYDDRQHDIFSSLARAPGADDNASGCSMVMEVGQILAWASKTMNAKFKYSIHLLATSKEESYLNGAYAYANELNANKTEVVAMLNADMISHLEPGEKPQIAYITTEATDWLMQKSKAITKLYLPNALVGDSPGCCDDHMAFTEKGFPGISFFERIGHVYSDNPFYHTVNDTFGNSANSMESVVLITKAIVASLGVIALPTDFTLL